MRSTPYHVSYCRGCALKVALATLGQFTESHQHQAEESGENSLEGSLRNFLVALSCFKLNQNFGSV